MNTVQRRTMVLLVAGTTLVLLAGCSGGIYSGKGRRTDAGKASSPAPSAATTDNPDMWSPVPTVSSKPLVPPDSSKPQPGSAVPPRKRTSTAVTATETEFSITLSTATFTPGAYVFNIQNRGKFPHNLNVKGPGVDGRSSPTFQPGGAGQLAVTLQKGSYELWC